ncbi:MAG: Acylphosphate phosphohydrolase, putative [uncultured Rubrobacteraceae bacterium]|uniref:Acylphosphatase n=1 Tax=uncultured Rubrobacteraceae bacterium TaxID=349277 RepID=A0A6J4R0J6_9ACTN|nr:MAG: Acylphosphate phosphohydrolase, putative [uncultured Rubrobacteraceae bacterium]
MQDERERADVRVTGRVQGVFFRDSARRNAERLGLSGWVRNSPDGAVEAVFEGPSEGVREMVRWCEQGPPDASVEDVSADFGPGREDLTGFEVR